MADHVLPHVRRRRRREARITRPGRQKVQELRNPQVPRTEIMAPLGYTVCFVDHDEARRIAPGKVLEIPVLQPFRRCIEELELPLSGIV